MALNIKNKEVERLAAQIATLTRESKTEAIRKSLELRWAQLRAGRPEISRSDRLQRFLREEVWPLVPADVRGKSLSREEEDRILGYGHDGLFQD